MPDKKTRAYTRRMVSGANVLLRKTGVALVPRWQVDAADRLPSFTVRGREYTGFCHRYNCGFPPLRMTERLVELAVADRWLEESAPDAVTEIGAVTPYYWPRRVSTIIDPYDTHRLVTHRVSLFTIDCANRDLLAISTLEHIELGDYGVTRSGESALQAFEKICRESRRFLITVPYGYNAAVDATLFAEYRFPVDVAATYMARSARGNDWREVAVHEAKIPYGPDDRDHHSANGLLIVERAAL
jgi:hypothetical protein